MVFANHFPLNILSRSISYNEYETTVIISNTTITILNIVTTTATGAAAPLTTIITPSVLVKLLRLLLQLLLLLFLLVVLVQGTHPFLKGTTQYLCDGCLLYGNSTNTTTSSIRVDS